MEKIDFVITWVDGDDPLWLAEKELHSACADDTENHPSKYRDWGLLRYWFRGIEKFAPWVHHIWFVTWGHIPDWLDSDHEKLTIVRHEDFIPAKFLPTFNSNTILLNIHRIQGLSRQFVLFNDDMYLTRMTNEHDFFRNQLPCGCALLGELAGIDMFSHMLLNNICAINHYFSKKEVMKKYWEKFYSPIYRTDVLRNIIFSPSEYFSNFKDSHLPSSYLLDSYVTVWENMNEELNQSCENRFRSKSDYTEWLIKDWQYCSGQFVPRKYNWGLYLNLSDSIEIESVLKKKKYKCICLNDSAFIQNVNDVKSRLQTSFQKLLPDKSDFEI